MSVYLSDSVLDALLNYLKDNLIDIILCSGYPTTVAEAEGIYYKMLFPPEYCTLVLSSSGVSGRQLTITYTEDTYLDVEETETVTHVAFTNGASTLYLVAPCVTTLLSDCGLLVVIKPIVVRAADPTAV